MPGRHMPRDWVFLEWAVGAWAEVCTVFAEVSATSAWAGDREWACALGTACLSCRRGRPAGCNDLVN